MNSFKFFWDTHKWIGISISAFLVITAVTGFLLLLKKEYAWIQPPTQKGSPGNLESFLSLSDAWRHVEAADHPDFQHVDDIDRIDVRVDKRVYKVRSKHNHTEIQIDAVSGAVLSTATRTSDWLENLHDGSWIGKPVHDYIMPLVAIAVLFMVFSGLWLWLQPKWKRRQRKKRDERAKAGSG